MLLYVIFILDCWLVIYYLWLLGTFMPRCSICERTRYVLFRILIFHLSILRKSNAFRRGSLNQSITSVLRCSILLCFNRKTFELLVVRLSGDYIPCTNMHFFFFCFVTVTGKRLEKMSRNVDLNWYEYFITTGVYINTSKNEVDVHHESPIANGRQLGDHR